MAPVPTYLDVTYLDAAGRRSTIAYRMQTEMEDDGSNIAAVLAAAGSIETGLNALTMSHIETTTLRVEVGGGGAAANVAANNQVVAFVRTVDLNGVKTSFEVPAWDDVLYSQDENNLLSGVFNAAAFTVADLLLNPETGSAMNEVSFSQSRTRRGARHLN